MSKQEMKEYYSTLAEKIKEQGFLYTAKYIEMFPGSWNPCFVRGANKETEVFYKKCVEEGHPWDYYIDFPEDAIF